METKLFASVAAGWLRRNSVQIMAALKELNVSELRPLTCFSNCRNQSLAKSEGEKKGRLESCGEIIHGVFVMVLPEQKYVQEELILGFANKVLLLNFIMHL